MQHFQKGVFMNTHQSNEKILQILSEMEPLRDENEEERKRREAMTEEAKRKTMEEEPLAFPKKVAGAACVAIWIFALVALMFGFGELGVLIPFMLLALAAVCGLNIPGFLKKGKIGDVIIGVIACGLCVILALGILFVGGNR